MMDQTDENTDKQISNEAKIIDCFSFIFPPLL